MVNQHRHRVRGLRGIDDELWADFEHAAAAAGQDKSGLCRQFIEWFVGRSGAALPDRPADGAETSDDAPA